MSLTDQDMRLVANAYRAALRRADDELAGSPVERKLLVAQVASSAQAVRTHLHTRISDGDVVGAALDDLIPELQKENVVGNSLASLEQSARSQATALISAVLTGAAWPAWVTTAVAAVSGAFAFSFEAGQVAGQALIALAAVSGGAVFYVFRALAMAGQAAGNAHESLWSAVDTLGTRAERVFAETVRPELLKAFGPTEGVKQPHAGAAVGSWLKVVVVLTYAFLAIAIAYFGLGLFSAFEASSPVPATPGFPSTS